MAVPVLSPLGLELVYAQCVTDGGRPVLRLFIDRLPADGQQAEEGDGSVSEISLDDCARASRAMDAALDADEGPQPEGYVLEVSSPGLNRPLLKEADYRRFSGRLARVKLKQGETVATVKGRLALTEAGGLALEADGQLIPFAYEEVVSARLLLDDLDLRPH